MMIIRSRLPGSFKGFLHAWKFVKVLGRGHSRLWFWVKGLSLIPSKGDGSTPDPAA